jgi:hypothetical protein
MIVFTSLERERERDKGERVL